MNEITHGMPRRGSAGRLEPLGRGIRPGNGDPWVFSHAVETRLNSISIPPFRSGDSLIFGVWADPSPVGGLHDWM